MFFLQELEGHETSVLVDRYKYLDLFPCTSLELKIMGYVVRVIFLEISSTMVPASKSINFVIILQ